MEDGSEGCSGRASCLCMGLSQLLAQQGGLEEGRLTPKGSHWWPAWASRGQQARSLCSFTPLASSPRAGKGKGQGTKVGVQ